MSDPIQSIAQNNYILATQQEVSHDNTLSGNGTVDSPIGVVPGYNETVLWSGTGDIITSESITNFERIRITISKGGTCEVVPNGTNIDFALIFWSEEDTSAMQFYAGRLSSSDGKTFTYSRVIRYWTAGSSGTSGNSVTNQKYIVKVVGINRIANN